jgi:hypothetical protein
MGFVKWIVNYHKAITRTCTIISSDLHVLVSVRCGCGIGSNSSSRSKRSSSSSMRSSRRSRISNSSEKKHWDCSSEQYLKYARTRNCQRKKTLELQFRTILEICTYQELARIPLPGYAFYLRVLIIRTVVIDRISVLETLHI